MTSRDKRKFVNDLIGAVRKCVLAKLPKTPDEWDGFELRQFITDHFQWSTYQLKGRRKRDYKDAMYALDVD